MSGIAVKVWLKKERSSSGARRSRPSGARWSMPPSAQHAAIASRSRAATASKYCRATLPGPGTLCFCSPARAAAPALTSVASVCCPVVSAASATAPPSSGKLSITRRFAAGWSSGRTDVERDRAQALYVEQHALVPAERHRGHQRARDDHLAGTQLLADRLQIAAHEPDHLGRVDGRRSHVDRDFFPAATGHASRQAG